MSDLELGRKLAAEGTRIALEAFEAKTYTVRRKADGSPVTDADVAVERALRALIAQHRPSHQIVGEEDGQTGHSDWCWYIDPIDGTSDFIDGGSRWMVLVALAHLGEIVMGVARAPKTGDEWWASKGQGAFRAASRLTVSRTPDLADAVVSDDWEDTLVRGTTGSLLATVAERCSRARPYEENSFLAVAAGLADIAIDVGGSAWDYAPLKIIVEEAGGRLTDRDGRSRFDGGHAIASNGLVHDAALELIEGSP